ncbi:MAG: hypothetical protein WDN66_02340 [Candidatus Saccharibacteria bacterium]
MVTDNSTEVTRGGCQLADHAEEDRSRKSSLEIGQKIASVFGALNREIDRDFVGERAADSIDVTNPDVDLMEVSEESERAALILATRRQTLRQTEQAFKDAGLVPDLPVSEPAIVAED